MNMFGDSVLWTAREHVGGMTDRRAELEGLVRTLLEFDAVDNAWVAKSFTDRVLVVETDSEELPPAIEARLREHDLRGANGVYGVEDEDTSFVGHVAGGSRHRFVDTRTRGEHRSYVVD